MLLYLNNIICDACFHERKITCHRCLFNVKEYVMSGEASRSPEVFCDCCQRQIDSAEYIYEDIENDKILCMSCFDRLDGLNDTSDIYED